MWVYLCKNDRRDISCRRWGLRYKMTEKEIRKLGRTELLGLLLEAVREKNELTEQKTEIEAQLNEAQVNLAAERTQAATYRIELDAVRKEFGQVQANLAVETRETESVREQLASAREQLVCAQEQLVAGQEALTAVREELRACRTELADEQARSAAQNSEIRRMREAMDSRVIIHDNAGSIAEAALQVNGIFDAAQVAADQYLAGIAHMKVEQERICRERDEETRRQAAQMIRETEELCAEMEREAREKCDAMYAEAENGVQRKWTSLSEELNRISMQIHESITAPVAEQ